MSTSVEEVRQTLDGQLVELPHNLRRKLAEVRKKIRNIPKKGTNTAQNYKFMRAEDVAGDIGDMLADMNVILARENISVVRDLIPREGKTPLVHVIITLDYIFLDGESNERIVVSSAGEGSDSSDKALPKAFTCALKYALTQALMMRVGDDAEADENGNGGHPEPPKTGSDAKLALVPDSAPPKPPQRTKSQGPPISEAQGRRLFAIAKGNRGAIQVVIERYGYTDSRTITRPDYESICNEVQQLIKNPPVDEAPPLDDEDIPF